MFQPNKMLIEWSWDEKNDDNIDNLDDEDMSNFNVYDMNETIPIEAETNKVSAIFS